MEIIFREMEPGEERAVSAAGKGSFGVLEGLLMPKPKKALLAIDGDKIAGAALYRLFKGRNQTSFGYIEEVYVTREYQDQGIGRRLYGEVTELVKRKGAVTVTAMVRDDNVASWKNFERNGYSRISFGRMLMEFGFFGSLQLWFYSIYCFAAGHELWATIPKEQKSSLRHIFEFLIINLLALFPILLQGAELRQVGIRCLAVLALLLAGLSGGRLALLGAKESWHFRTAGGGILTALLVGALGGVFPVSGRFYPDAYGRSKEFRSSMGREALMEWAGVLLLFLISFLLKEQGMVWKRILDFGGSILLYHALPCFPLGSFGGRRIWDASKPVSLAVLTISLGLLYLL